MFLLEADLAIFSRLTGAPLDSQGRPLLDAATKVPVNRHRIMPPEAGGGYGPSYGVRIPALKNGQDLAHGLTSKDTNSSRLFAGYSSDTFRQVPVFDENIEGRNWADIFPCVTFRLVAPEFDPSVFIYYDPFVSASPGADPVDIVNRLGEVVDSGYDGYTLRPEPDGYRLRYAIMAQAKSRIEMNLLVNQIIYLFPARGALQVQFADGTTHACDMLQVDINDLSQGLDNSRPGAGAEEQRFYKTAFYYDVEAYVDNTRNAYGNQNPEQENVILQRVIELNNEQERLFRRFELNAEELSPI